MSYKVAPDKYKVLNDCVHGHIKLHPLCVKIMDTPEFQRLRNLKQVGPVYFVYPGASHNRFEHSLGVCYLAGQMVEALRRNKPDIISDDEKLGVEVAALCHDLGHGPISHTWERFLASAGKDWKHEECSIKMFKHLIEKNDLRREVGNFLEKMNVDEFINFIENLIKGDDKNDKGEKQFLFQIVSNKSNGIDVDRWDYFLRDGLQLNIHFIFNYRRLLEFCQVMNVKGNNVICFKKKEAQNIYDMFMTRAKLHQKAYRHHVVEIIEEMIIDAFCSADRAGFKIKGKLLSEAQEDMEAFSQMSDHIFYNILWSEEEAFENAKVLLRRILCRDLYILVACKSFSYEVTKAISDALCQSIDEVKKCLKEQEKIFMESLQEDISTALDGMKILTEDKFTIRMIKLDLGIEMHGALGEPGKKINPFTNIYFYDKHTEGAKEIDWKEIPIFQVPEESLCRIDGLIIYKNNGRDHSNYEAEQKELELVKQKLKEKWNNSVS